MLNRLKVGSTGELNAYQGVPGEVSLDIERKALRVYDGSLQGGFEIIGKEVEIPTPGSQELIAGTLDEGYYGQVEMASFFTPTELATALGISEGVVNPEENSWLKFAHRGKTLYIPRRPIRTAISWRAIYQAGAVYGTGDNGTFPSGGSRIQNAQVTKGMFSFRVRLIRGKDEDPGHTPAGGEFRDLLHAVHISDPQGRAWENFNNDDMTLGSGAGRNSWVVERHPTSSSSRGATGSSLTSITHYAADGTATQFGWRPVLELID